MAKGIPNERYTPEFKQKVVEEVMNEGPSYKEAQRQFGINGNDRVQSWERIYLTEDPEDLAIERRGRSSTGRPRIWREALSVAASGSAFQ